MKFKLFALSGLMAVTMGLTACDSHKEEAVEDLNDAQEEVHDAHEELEEGVAEGEAGAVEAQAQVDDAQQAADAAEAAAMGAADDTTEAVVVEEPVVAE